MRAEENISSRVFVGEDSPEERNLFVLCQEEGPVFLLFLNNAGMLD